MNFEHANSESEMRQWKQLKNYFISENDNCLSPQIKKIMFKNGCCIFPSDWIVLENIDGKFENCENATVVECKNGNLYNVPHFICFHNEGKYACDYPEDLEGKIYSACSKVYPDFGKIFNLQVNYSLDEILNDKNKEEKYKIAPCFGLFNIVEKGDPKYWYEGTENYVPPYNAMIIK